MQSQLLLAAVVAAFILADSASAAERDGEDFICLGDSGPVLIRFHVRIDGKLLRDAWEDFMGQLFAYLDRNGDGVLNTAEALRAPPAQVLFNNVPNYVGQRSKIPEGMDKNRDGKITRAELAAWYRAIGAAPLQIQVVPVQNQLADRVLGSPNQLLSADAINESLFTVFDVDKDGKLSREELARAPDILHKIDLNEDEAINVQELTENIWDTEERNTSTPGFLRNGPANNGPFVPVEPGDANKDSTPHHADLEFRIGLDEKTGRRSGLELVTIQDKPFPLAKWVRPLSGGKLLLLLGSSRIELSRGESSVASENDFPRLRREHRAQLLRADQDSNGYLDNKEAMQAPLYRNAFRLMDLNGDGKLFEKEVIAYLDKQKRLQESAVRSCAALVVRDQGRGLFDLIDVNKDGQLGVRELKQMVKLVEQLDRDGDGKINRSEIPHRYQVDVRRGPGLGNPSTPAVVVVRKLSMNDQPDISQGGGPLWFQKMDRNHDGEVSRREFLGTEEIFRKIDQDGDGLISIDEAKRADGMFRTDKARKP